MGSLERGELLRALGAAVELLPCETDELDEEATNLEQQLRQLSEPAALVTSPGSPS